MGVHSRGGGSRVRISQFADDELVSWRERPAHAFEVFPRSQSVLSGVSSRPAAGDPELTEDQADWDSQEGELDARVPASLCSSAERRFHKLMHINRQSFDIAGGVHVGKDDLDVGAGDQDIRLGYDRGEDLDG